MPEESSVATVESPEPVSMVPETDAIEQPSVPSEAVVEPQTPTEEPVEPQQEAPPSDGRVIPPQWRDLFKQDSKLRGIFFSERAYREQFPEGPRQAIELRDGVNNFLSQYGVESLDEVSEQVAEERAGWEALDEQYSKADPEFIKSISSENPDAFVSLMPTALDRLYELDTAAYNNMMAKVIISTLNQGPLAEVYNLLNSQDTTKGFADKLAKWYNDLNTLAKNQPEKKVNPEAEKLAKERQEFEDQKAQAYHQQVESDMRQFSSSLIEKLVAKEYAKSGRDLASEKSTDPDSYMILANNCRDAILKAIPSTEQKQFQKLLVSGDADKAKAFARAKIERVAPEAINRIYRLFNRNISPSKPRATQTSSTSPVTQASGTIPLSRPPAHRDIDWQRMRLQGLTGVEGKVYLKGRKELFSF